MYSIKFHFKAGQRAPDSQNSGKAGLGKGPPRSLSFWGLVGWAGNANLSKSWMWDYSPVSWQTRCLELE